MVDAFFQIAVLLFSLFLGARLGGLGVGYAGGLGVLVLCLFLGLNPGKIPFDVILIIMAVISAISAMQKAGGLDYLVKIAEKILRKHPKQINYLAPSVAYCLTILAGTGHTVFSLIPVIVEVSQSQNIKPKAPLSLAVVSSQVAITASPVSRGGGVYERYFRAFRSELLDPFNGLDPYDFFSMHAHGVYYGLY
ncbi:hypothetical protein HpNP132_14920 [Helicobacter pylori]